MAPCGIKAEIEFALAGHEPLRRDLLQRSQLRLVVRRTDVLDVARSATRTVHDLHRRRPRRGPHRAHVRHEPTRYDDRLVRRFDRAKPLQPPEHGTPINEPRDLGPSQVADIDRTCHPFLQQAPLRPNSLGKVDDASFISLDLRLENSATHWDVVRRVARRARRSGVAIEAADDAFAYVAFYARDGDHSALNTELATSHMDEFRRIMPPDAEHDGRDLVVINVSSGVLANAPVGSTESR